MTMSQSKRKKRRQRKKKLYNVLLLTVDDLRPEFGEVFDFPEVLAPNIDKLGRQPGTTVFHQAFCQMPTCGASRTSVLTGRRPDTTQVLKKNNGCFRDGIGHDHWISLPHAFRNHGYTTAGSGKLFHDGVCDGKHVGEDRDAWTMQPYFHCRCASGLYNGQCENSQFRPKSVYANNVTMEDMCDGEIVQSAQQQLRNVTLDYRLTGQPFFLSVGFRKPHLPHIVPQHYFDSYSSYNVSLPPNPSIPHHFPSDAWNPSWEFRSYDDAHAEAAAAGYNRTTSLSVTETQKHRSAYFAAVTFVDDMIGRVLSELERLKMMDTTIVALWGDHGWHLGDQNEWGKHTMFTRANRIPLMVHMPGTNTTIMDASSSSHDYVEAIDLYPTLLELAGLPVPPTCRNAVEAQYHPQCMEGSSFASLVVVTRRDNNNNDEQNSSRPSKTAAAFSQWPMPQNQEYMGYSVWANVEEHSYRYTEWVRYQCPTYQDEHPKCKASQYGPNWTDVRAIEMYDLTLDPEETHNVAGNRSLSSVELQLLTILRRGWRGSSTTTMRSKPQFEASTQ